VRQGHPGPGVRAYQSFEQKQQDARRHHWEDAIPWPVLVDDLDGRVHRAYGMLADPTVLVDADGRVAFYNAVTHAPTLDRAIRRLMRQRERGVVLGGVDRRPHLLAAVAAGWPALERGLPQSAVDLETALPTSALLPFVGHHLKPLAAPLALRSTPIPRPARSALLVAVAAALGAAVLSSAAHKRRPSATRSPRGPRDQGR
jgi:hypothetical protein